MARAVERFQAAAQAAGVAVEVRRFPEETRTAAYAARAIGCDVGQIVKSLVFMGDGEAVLALTSGANRADPERLARALHLREVRKAGPEEVREATGYAIGGTPPFGHVRRLRALVDRDLLGYGLLWAAAGAPDSVFPIRPADLVEATGAVVADFKADVPS